MNSDGPVYRARILGCGSSGGVPRIDGDWGACDPENPKNRRLRCSLLVEKAPNLQALEAGELTRVLIDTSPDLREQMLAAKSDRLDGIIYTHTHADQAHGIDDVRAYVYRQRALIDTVMSPETHKRLMERFGYIFETPKGSGYPPLLKAHIVEPGSRFEISGPGGPLQLSLFDVLHGKEPCSGVRLGPIAYTPDVNGLDATAFQALAHTGLWIVDCLRETPHPSHAHLDQTLDWIAQVQPGQSVLTNLHIDLDYETLLKRCPEQVEPAYDGLTRIVSET